MDLTLKFDYLYLTRQCDCSETKKQMYVSYSPSPTSKAAKAGF